MARQGTLPTIWGGIPYLSEAAAWRKLSGNRQLFIGLMLASIITAAALLAPILPIDDPLSTDYDYSLQGPDGDHPLGTDLHGRDILSRVIWAARPSLLVGFVATAIALAVGTVIGGISGLGGRNIDTVLMRTTDVFLSFPVILGAIAIMAILGPGLRNVFFAIALFGWPVFARLFRSSIITTRETDYVKAAQIMGASKRQVFLRHILPNSSGPLIAYSAIAAAAAILAEAGLSFINLGVQRPHPSWGLMLAESRGLFEQAPWLAVAPGLAVTITALAFILIGSSITSSADGYAGGNPGDETDTTARKGSACVIRGRR